MKTSTVSSSLGHTIGSLPRSFNGSTDGQASLTGFAAGSSSGHTARATIPSLKGTLFLRRHPQKSPTTRLRRVRVRGKARDLVLRVDAPLLLFLVFQEHGVRAERSRIRIRGIYAAHRRQRRSSTRRRCRHKVADRTAVKTGLAAARR